MEVLHSGFDKLEVAFNGALSSRLRAALEAAKTRAKAANQPELIDLNGVDVWVKDTGAKGGYAFVFETEGGHERFTVKDNPEQSEFNLRVTVSAQRMAVDGWQAVVDRLIGYLAEWRTRTTEISVARVDYAVDFIDDSFSLDPACLINHSHTNVKQVYEDEDFSLSVNWKARRPNSVTIGKMPGRQIIIYDKTREVSASGKGFWNDVWGRCPLKGCKVWRVEVRAGKEHLTRAGIKSFEDVQEKIGTLFREAMDKVRLAAEPDFENATRAATDPRWIQAQRIVSECIEGSQGEVTWERVIEGQRDEIADIYRRQIVGCAIGYAHALGKSFREFLRTIHYEIGTDIDILWDGDRSRLADKWQRANARLKFIEKPASNDDKGVYHDFGIGEPGGYGDDGYWQSQAGFAAG